MGIISYNSCDVMEMTRKSIISLTVLVSVVVAALATDQSFQQLPFCGDSDERTISRRLLYITTLDGRLTALDISQGDKHWSIETSPGPLISSSIHRLELTNNGQWVRMIPSLNGGLYKFDGESIDPIPITAENLLSSSFKFSDDLVISGGKETRSYGVSARTGQLLYECSMQGCTNATNTADSSIPNDNVKRQKFGPTKPNKHKDNSGGSSDEDFSTINNQQHDPLLDDVVVVRRQTQTVRAIEPRTGAERWNFSVGHHELELLQSPECHEKSRTDVEMKILDIDVTVIVPEGILLAFNRNNPRKILWKYKFDHPIVNAWRIDGGDQMKYIDLFNSTQWMWSNNDPNGWISPSIYIGMFQKQLYIQESQNLLKTLVAKTRNFDHNLLNDESQMPSIPWKPISATSISSRVLLTDDTAIVTDNKNSLVTKSEIKEETSTQIEENTAATAISVLYASEYVNGNGFFLFSSADSNQANSGLCDSQNSTSATTITNETDNDDFNFEFIDDDDTTPVKIIIVSLWFWWKEIVVISLTSAIVLNLFLTPRIRREREVVVIERHIPVPTAIEATEESVTAARSRGSQRSLSESNSHDSNGLFQSRFQTDFDLVQCLGKGGFGVVFEAKNKIDDCNYAVKRIALPNKKESRDRVMREVKTLANCEHHNIVRYFQAWVENPPPGWQEEEDMKWMQRDILSTSIDIETPEGTTLPPFSTNNTAAIETKSNWKKFTITNCNNYGESNKSKKLDSWISSLKSEKSLNEFSVNGEFDKSLRYIDDKSLSFIEFKADDGDENTNKVTNGIDVNNDDDEKRNNYESINKSIGQSTAIKMIGTQTKFGPPQIELDNDDSDSFEIEFRETSNDGGGCGQDKSSIFNGCNNNNNNNRFSMEKPKSNCCTSISNSSKSKSTSCNSVPKIPTTTRHKRPLSLDLSSRGNVIVPISPSPQHHHQQYPQQQQQQQQNKVYLYIQMQLCQKQSLKDWLREHKTEIRQPHIRNIFKQILNGVGYVHLKGLIHRDLKPSNIFFSLDGQIKIGDFGLVTDMPPPSPSPSSSALPSSSTALFENHKNGMITTNNHFRHTQQVGTHLYMSPEQLQGHPYDYKVDIYSLGLIYFELLNYFSTEMERILTLKDLRNGQFPNDFHQKHPDEHKLLQLMLSLEPEKRPTTTQIALQIENSMKSSQQHHFVNNSNSDLSLQKHEIPINYGLTPFWNDQK